MECSTRWVDGRVGEQFNCISRSVGRSVASLKRLENGLKAFNLLEVLFTVSQR